MTDHAITTAEKAIVAACINDPHLIRVVAKHVTPADFANRRLGDLYGLIASLVTAYGPHHVNAVSLAEETRRLNAGTTEFTPTTDDIDTLRRIDVTGDVTVHARYVAEEALSRRLAVYGRRVTTDAESGVNPSVVATKAMDELRSLRDEHLTTGLPTKPLSDVLADESLAVYDWVVPGLLEAGDRLVVTGWEGRGKSTLLRQIALCTAAGIHPFAGQRFDPRTVLVVDAENSERQWHRKSRFVNDAVSRLAGFPAADRVHLACVPRRDLTTARHLGEVHAAIDDLAPDMVVIGPFYKLVPTAINNDTDAAPLITALDSIHERGVVLVMEAHSGHGLGSGGVRDTRPRGSAALLGWPEFGFGIVPDTDDPSLAHVVRWRGDRDERDWPQQMRMGGRLPWTDARVAYSQEGWR